MQGSTLVAAGKTPGNDEEQWGLGLCRWSRRTSEVLRFVAWQLGSLCPSCAILSGACQEPVRPVSPSCARCDDRILQSPDLLAGPLATTERGRGHRQAPSNHWHRSNTTKHGADKAVWQAWVTPGAVIQCDSSRTVQCMQPGTIPGSQRTKGVVASSRLAGAVDH